MDIRGPTRIRSTRSPSPYPFLGESLHAPIHPNPSPDSSAAVDEFTEDEIFATGDFSENNFDSDSPSPTPSSSSSTPSRSQNRLSRLGYGSSESFGILAALSEKESHSLFNHKALVPASSSRGIPLISKPPQDRIPPGNLPYSAIRYHQSAPLNVSVSPNSTITRGRDLELQRDDGDDDKMSDDEDGPMLPPHEIVARSLAKSQGLACSVLEGAGRTLKGRDMRQVRNAVFRHTGMAAHVKNNQSFTVGAEQRLDSLCHQNLKKLVVVEHKLQV